MDHSPNLQLSYLMAAQSQKHVTYNEAMRALDALVQQTVLDIDLADPPGSPADGDRYIVAASPTGAWSGQAGKLAAWQDGAWAFYTPREGWLVWVADEDVLYVYDGTSWDELSTSGSGGAALDALGALSPAADRLAYFTGASTAALAPFTTFARSLVDDADAAAARTTLGLVIGTDVQAYDAELACIAGLTSATDKLAYFTGSGTAALADFTAFGRSLVDDANAGAALTTLGVSAFAQSILDDANAAAARTTLGLAIGTDVQAYDADLTTLGAGGSGARSFLGLGTAATQNTGTSGANVPLLNAANTWSAAPTISFSAAGAALLTLADTAFSRSLSMRFNDGGVGELKFQTSGSVINVASFHNTHASGFSAISFYGESTSDVEERAAFGYGNSTCPSPFTGKAYFEASNLLNGAINGYTPLILVTTGDIPNFGGDGNHVRQEFIDSGDTLFYAGAAGTTVNLRLRHELGATLGGQLWISPADNLLEALKIGDYTFSGATTGNVAKLGAVFSGSGVMTGLLVAINNSGAVGGSTGLKVTGAPVYFDASNSGDGPRATGLTVTVQSTANFTPGSDPGDAKRIFSLISPGTGSTKRPAILCMRNTQFGPFMDMVLDPNYSSETKFFYQWNDGKIALMMWQNGVGIGGNVAALTSHCTIAAGTTAKSQLNLASSTAPSSPVNGDIWFDGTDLKLRAGGTTYTVTKT